MAYKNKSKQKKHVSQLSNTGWRKDKADQKRISELAKVYGMFTDNSRDAYDMAKKKLGL